MLREGDHLRVTVEDNGVGFAPDQLSSAPGKMEGFGLFSIRERLNYFGGSMEIESTSGQATRVILTIPVQHDKKKQISRMQTPAAAPKAHSPAASEVSSRPPAKPSTPPSCAIN
jgi:signal transduction histidine kinase